MKTESNTWSIDYVSGHCKHLDGLDAYIGHTDSENFIPVLGPYSPYHIQESDVALAIVELIQAIEESDGSRIVAWGSLDNSRSGRSIQVLGLDQYWIPDPSARTNWLQICKSRAESSSLKIDFGRCIEKEWTFSPDPYSITHRSNIAFSFSDTIFNQNFTRMITDQAGTASLFTNNPDTTIIHPHSIHDSIHALAKAALSVLADANQLEYVSKVLQLNVDVAANTLNL